MRDDMQIIYHDIKDIAETLAYGKDKCPECPFFDLLRANIGKVMGDLARTIELSSKEQ